MDQQIWGMPVEGQEPPWTLDLSPSTKNFMATWIHGWLYDCIAIMLRFPWGEWSRADYTHKGENDSRFQLGDVKTEVDKLPKQADYRKVDFYLKNVCTLPNKHFFPLADGDNILDIVCVQRTSNNDNG